MPRNWRRRQRSFLFRPARTRYCRLLWRRRVARPGAPPPSALPAGLVGLKLGLKEHHDGQTQCRKSEVVISRNKRASRAPHDTGVTSRQGMRHAGGSDHRRESASLRLYISSHGKDFGRPNFGRARAYGTPTVLGRCSRSRMPTLCGEEKGRNSAPTLDRGHASVGSLHFTSPRCSRAGVGPTIR